MPLTVNGLDIEILKELVSVMSMSLWAQNTNWIGGGSGDKAFDKARDKEGGNVYVPMGRAPFYEDGRRRFRRNRSSAATPPKATKTVVEGSGMALMLTEVAVNRMPSVLPTLTSSMNPLTGV